MDNEISIEKEKITEADKEEDQPVVAFLHSK